MNTQQSEWTRSLETNNAKFWRFAGMFFFALVVLALAGLFLTLLFRNFDYTTVLTLAVIACIVQFIWWPLGWSLGSHMTERIFRTWYEGHAGQPAPAIVNPAAEPPPANVRAMIPLDVTEAEAKEFLASLGA